MINSPLIVLISLILTSTVSWGQPPPVDHSKHNQTIELDPLLPHPTLRLELIRDETDGFNLKLLVESFTLEAPPKTQKQSLEYGHAHIYLNDIKLMRLYGPDLHLPGRLFKQGISSLKVSLNNHQHAVLTINGAPIETVLLVDPSRAAFILSEYISGDK